MDVISNNSINNSRWQAHYRCLSAPTVSDKRDTKETDGILKCVRKWPWDGVNSSVRGGPQIFGVSCQNFFIKSFLHLCVAKSKSWPVWRAIGPFCILMHANFCPNGCPHLRSCSLFIYPPEGIELDGCIADSDLSPNGRIKAVTRSDLFIPQTRLNSKTLSPNSFMPLFFFNKVNSALLAALLKKKASAYWKCSSSASEVGAKGSGISPILHSVHRLSVGHRIRSTVYGWVRGGGTRQR